jgi:hypothetical protein
MRRPFCWPTLLRRISETYDGSGLTGFQEKKKSLKKIVPAGLRVDEGRKR